jgi:UDPglucose 6-dehydrogenase
MSIGCVGFGFVGKALSSKFAQTHDVHVYDISIPQTTPSNITFHSSICEMVATLEMSSPDRMITYFVCVPTPMDTQSGECDTTIVKKVVGQLKQYISRESIVVIKSTLSVGTVRSLEDNNKLLTVAFNPEFLTERNASLDFANQKRAIIGLRTNDTEVRLTLETAYKRSFGEEFEVQFVLPEEAEMTKLMLNSFWAVKVAFANEIYSVCQASDIDYNTVLRLVLADERIGKTHLYVPGLDGKRGFGGVCLPKDLCNLRYCAKKLDTETPVLDATWISNLLVRDPDWTELKGRAVSE